MSDFPKNAMFSRRDMVVANDLSSSETVMLDIDRGMYFGVREVGKTIWATLATPSTIDQLCQHLMQTYAVDEATCEQEVTEFLVHLSEQGLIEVDKGDR